MKHAGGVLGIKVLPLFAALAVLLLVAGPALASTSTPHTGLVCGQGQSCGTSSTSANGAETQDCSDLTPPVGSTEYLFVVTQPSATVSSATVTVNGQTSQSFDQNGGTIHLFLTTTGTFTAAQLLAATLSTTPSITFGNFVLSHACTNSPSTTSTTSTTTTSTTSSTTGSGPTTTGATPELDSIVLFGVGVLALSGFGLYQRRRNGHRA